MNIPRDIKIKPVLNGYRVKVGCVEVIFDSRKKLLKELKRYLKNPDKVEEEYQRKVNSIRDSGIGSLDTSQWHILNTGTESSGLAFTTDAG